MGFVGFVGFVAVHSGADCFCLRHDWRQRAGSASNGRCAQVCGTTHDLLGCFESRDLTCASGSWLATVEMMLPRCKWRMPYTATI
ncbi:hypothetical protein BZA05DRAFT_390486 [Tricharina praecox]|uniref:uncharacterized protein n=1 Tax=Tricharina praecox TaxID=43433 RepID=UPI00221F4491|nr:uncharacterized protein BZA05DRAFT_390486 [Tricharina praecox]KAI5856055.1 hypothetical protein BZA05DRAFT_390486 [Tricharina praecox]